MNTATQEGRAKRLAQLERKEVERLLKRYKETGSLAVAGILVNKYGLGDFLEEFSNQ